MYTLYRLNSLVVVEDDNRNIIHDKQDSGLDCTFCSMAFTNARWYAAGGGNRSQCRERQVCRNDDQEKAYNFGERQQAVDTGDMTRLTCCRHEACLSALQPSSS